ncbi:MAG: hypothetical protein F4186_06400 [Boseongicola sp. SB0676_bin_33]|uniref:DUF296 domain-containing protein n=1 Tax=Boseongicola sp. SB0664_bin_43 TaxID=2604844 RepID=A0A6B0XYB9_9RHOB|nr:hypothetical protein [Boseongicola sp. SB0664_bin_43]MYF89005.1 hypothetical protein [Boseongicola sp. SB0676_bin_33]MYK31489.1 hypothetical protein [Boseongicola sp. SB0670_bin_30]
MKGRAHHPGPPLSVPHVAVGCRATPISFELGGGDVLLPAIAAHLAAEGVDSALLTIRDAPLRALDFIGPHWPDPEGQRAAWYSETRSLRAPARLIEMTIVFGSRNGAPFIHGHGTWAEYGHSERFGHVLPDRCVFAGAATVKGWRLDGARFETAECPETRFAVFHPIETRRIVDADQPANASLVKLSPNVEFGTELAYACARAGFIAARAFGLGSLVAAHFRDGRVLNSRASEILIRDGWIVAPGALGEGRLDIRITGVEQQIMDGVLGPGNLVLITAEVLLLSGDPIAGT